MYRYVFEYEPIWGCFTRMVEYVTANNPEQAKIVQRVFREYEEGWTPSEIAYHLNEDKVKGIRGKVAWHAATIRGMLANEKYKGDARLQKTFTEDFLSKKRVKNMGQVEQYYVQNSHKPIIPKDE